MQTYEMLVYGLLGTFDPWYINHNINAIIKCKDEECATDGFLGNRDGADGPQFLFALNVFVMRCKCADGVAESSAVADKFPFTGLTESGIYLWQLCPLRIAFHFLFNR